MKKTRSWFWFFVQLLPLLAFAFFMFARLGQGSVQYGTMLNMLNDFHDFASQWQCEPVSRALRSVCDTIGLSSLIGLDAVIHLISYEIFVLFMRIFYEVIAFLPKFCISFFERKM